MNDMMNEGVMKQEKRAETNYNCRVSSTSEKKDLTYTYNNRMAGLYFSAYFLFRLVY
jgi:hypothetical protein